MRARWTLLWQQLGLIRHRFMAALGVLLFVLPSPMGKLGVLGSVLLWSSSVEARSNGITVPGCEGCHIVSGAQLTFTAEPPAFGPGEDVTLSVEVRNVTFDNGAAGVYLAPPELGVLSPFGGEGLTQLQSGGLVHSQPKSVRDGLATFRFLWRVPQEAGAVRLRAYGLAANGDGRSSSDFAGEADLLVAFGCDVQEFYYDLDGDGSGSDEFATAIGCQGRRQQQQFLSTCLPVPSTRATPSTSATPVPAVTVDPGVGGGAATLSGGTGGMLAAAGSAGDAGATNTVGGGGGAGGMGLMGEAGQGGPSLCPVAGATLCDGFEGPAPGAPGSDWTVAVDGGNTMSVDTAQAYRGTNSMRFSGSSRADIVETVTFAGAMKDSNNAFWGRYFILSDLDDTGGVQSHAVYGTLAGDNNGDEFHFVGGSRGRLQAEIRLNNGDRYTGGGTSPIASAAAYPISADGWQCWEWHVSADDSFEFYINGVEQENMRIVTGSGGPNGSVTFSPMPVFASLSLGWQYLAMA